MVSALVFVKVLVFIFVFVFVDPGVPYIRPHHDLRGIRFVLALVLVLVLVLV